MNEGRWEDDRGGHLWKKDREVVTDDGARIRYTVRGPEDGPWLVLAAGFLCPDNFWMFIGPRLMERYRVVVMNYRGVGASSHPRPPGYRTVNVDKEDYTIGKFAGDVTAVIEAEDASEVTVLGHSMGVQVALELWRQQPERVAALVLVTGPYASPLHTFYGSKLGTHLFPFAYLGLPLLPRPVQRGILKIVHTPIAMPIARFIRALGPDTPAEGMHLYFEHLRNVDPMIGLKIARGMHDFDSEAWLDQVDAPTLVVVGSRDTFSPPELGRFMVDQLPDGELVEIEGGTHGALIEFPDEIHDAVVDFLERRLGHGGASAAVSNQR
ncbi:MAG: alpha/beta hydrolase [Nitriliruptorales bacterium]|nr:alpha/beta hydrolase [Nitriliruptorales bacterium]